MFPPQKTLKCTFPCIFSLKCLLFSFPNWLSPIISIFWKLLAVLSYFWLPGTIFLTFDVTATCFDIVLRNKNFWSATLLLLFLSFWYVFIGVCFFHSSLLLVLLAEKIYCSLESVSCVLTAVILSLQTANFYIHCRYLMLSEASQSYFSFLACIFNVPVFSFKLWISSFKWSNSLGLNIACSWCILPSNVLKNLIKTFSNISFLFLLFVSF